MGKSFSFVEKSIDHLSISIELSIETNDRANDFLKLIYYYNTFYVSCQGLYLDEIHFELTPRTLFQDTNLRYKA